MFPALREVDFGSLSLGSALWTQINKVMKLRLG